ncbi:hypothetical protein K438DRAFT_1757003 [Mycena galopus ATCC 62051]|nr:hypothetical protein K438DRAFT_1757003 [Mycena galopus ATCC 62051]
MRVKKCFSTAAALRFIEARMPAANGYVPSLVLGTSDSRGLGTPLVTATNLTFPARVFAAAEHRREPTRQKRVQGEAMEAKVEEAVNRVVMGASDRVPARLLKKLSALPGFEAKIWKTNSKLGDFSSVAPANFESPQGSLMGLTESAGARWMVPSRKDLVKALPPLKIKVPGTAAGGRAKKIAKNREAGSSEETSELDDSSEEVGELSGRSRNLHHGRLRARQMPTDRTRGLNDDGVKIISKENLKLIREISSGPGYFLHTGQANDRAVIVRVFNVGLGPTVRHNLESIVALSKKFMHPNVLPLYGISSPKLVDHHFIVYETVRSQNAAGPLAKALKTDLGRSITLAFKMMAGLSAGINYLSVQGVPLGLMGAENFDVLFDVNDRLGIIVHPMEESDIEGHRPVFASWDRLSNPSLPPPADFQEREKMACDVFIALRKKILISANRAAHSEQIDRDPDILDTVDQSSNLSEKQRFRWGLKVLRRFLAASELWSSVLRRFRRNLAALVPSSQHNREEEPIRPLDHGQQSLATVAHGLALELDIDPPLRTTTRTHRESPHRCVGYAREEITLAATALDSVIVAHDAPSPKERCSICGEIVGVDETFRCICGDVVPGSGHTIKCQACKFWCHSDCVGNPKNGFTCRDCLSRHSVEVFNIQGGVGGSGGPGGYGGSGTQSARKIQADEVPGNLSHAVEIYSTVQFGTLRGTSSSFLRGEGLGSQSRRASRGGLPQKSSKLTKKKLGRVPEDRRRQKVGAELVTRWINTRSEEQSAVAPGTGRHRRSRSRRSGDEGVGDGDGDGIARTTRYDGVARVRDWSA